MERIFAYIDSRRDEYLDRLLRFCRQKSVSATGEGVCEMVALLEKEMRDLGVSVERVETSGNPILYGTLEGTGPRTISFYNHYDVQPEDPLDQWLSPPYAAEIRDGKVFARGVADNKDGLASRLCAVDAYQKVYGTLPLNLKFIFEGEEEIGSPHLIEFADRFPRRLDADGFAWEGGYQAPDGSPEISLGSKGMLYVEMSTRVGASDAHSSNAAIVSNAMWRLAWALSTLKDQNDRILIDGFYDNARPVSEKDMEALKTAFFDEEDFKRSMKIDRFIGDLTGDALLAKLRYEPVCNVSGIKSGYIGPGVKTIVPATASAKLDFRLVPDQDPDEIFRLLRASLDKRGFSDVELSLISATPPYNSPAESPFVQSVIRCAEKVYHMKPAVYRNGAGSSPMHALCKKRKSPAVQFGCTNSKAQIHAPNENTAIEDYFNVIKMLVAVIKDFSETEK